MKKTIRCLSLCLIILLIPLCFLGCRKKEANFEGEVCELEYKEAYTTTVILPIYIYNGKTTTLMMIPYIRSYPDRYRVKVQNYNDNKQSYDYYECYVTKECFDNLKIGDWFVYDKDFCFKEEPYTQVKA